MAKTDGVARIIALAALGKNGGGSTGGTTNYLELANKPKINNVELTGNKTLEDLGINIPDLENYYTKDMVNEAFLTKTNTTSFTPTGDYNPATKKYVDDALANIDVSFDDVYVVTCGHRFDWGSFDIIDDGSITEMMNKYWPKYLANRNQGGLVIWKDYTATTNGTILIGYMWGTEIYIQWPWNVQNNWFVSNPYGSVGVVTITGSWDSSTETYTLTEAVWNRTNYVPTQDWNPATKKYVDDNAKTYTAGENITISEDNVISANVSGGTDSNAVYTYYTPYSDDDWFTEGNVAAILQAVKDNGYSNFELCTLNGSHYTLTKGGNLQALTATDEAFELLSQQNNLENHTNYTFNAHLNENNKVVVSGLVKTVHTAEEMFGTYLPETLEKISGYDGTREHLILQANAGNLEWDSSLDGGIFGDNYTDPAYYTEKQVDKIVTDTVNEALGGRY